MDVIIAIGQFIGLALMFFLIIAIIATLVVFAAFCVVFGFRSTVKLVKKEYYLDFGNEYDDKDTEGPANA